ncbi:hypothetical protein C5688_09125 [Methylocystis sp. MitZ-2018]|nr:hypothetical protein C5688_09125 [Methylocystis sp. MitZ-2018]
MRSRLLKDGRRTLKRKPGPRPPSVAQADPRDRDMLIFLHALKRHPKLKDIFCKLKGGPSKRAFAKAAIAVVDGYVEQVRIGGVLRLQLYSAARATGKISTPEQLDATADLLLRKHRAIARDTARADDRAFLDKYADALFFAATPRRAALPQHPIIATPAGLFGAGVKATKRVMRAAGKARISGEPAWVTAARLGALAINVGASESRRVALRACDDLKAIGFPIDQVLCRLDLLQHDEVKEQNQC